MSIALRVSLLIGIMVYLFFIFFFLKKKTINLKYSLIWLLTAVVLLVFDAFPGLVEKMANLIGVESVVNFIFLTFVFFILLILISLTSIVSKQHNQIKSLVQELSILEKKVEELNK